MKIVEFFKNLFKKSYEPVLSGRQDIFGYEIPLNEVVYPIKYNELHRCGYVTIDATHTGFYPKPIKEGEQPISRCVAQTTLINRNLIGKVKKGQRGNFYHVYR